LESLPHKHVDTGLGFERVLSAVQGKHSNYDTDLFTPIFAHIGTLLGHEYGASDSPQDVAFRVVADHMRAVSSALADGVLPANTGRGYVLRRLIRRAARYGRQELGAEDPFLFEVAPAVAAVLGSAFPEIPQRMEHIQLLVRNEEEAFARTLGRGLVRFQELADKVQKSKRSTLGGAEAYDLYATYGFPEDLVELMARERSLQVDREGWVEAHRRHQEASRSEGKFKQKVPPELLANLSATRSTYHEEGERAGCVVTHGRLLGAGSENAFVVLGESPFYAEAGGQIGDVGTIATTDGVFEFQVEDTQRIGEVVVHLGTVVRGSLEDGAEVRAVVDTARRDRTRKNHTATHLLHKALRDELGDHVRQQGSYVGPDRLRFDFSHPAALSKEELEGVERAVSEQIAKDTPVTTTVRDLEEAKQAGAMALFGEKYADRVRVVSVSDYSMELCGGTHVRRLGEIESVVVTHEGSAAAGVRRIEAVAGAAAARAALDQRKEREVERAQALERKQEAKERDRARRAEIRHRIGASTGSLLEEAEKVGEITVAAGVVDREDPEALRALADRIRVAAGECIVILAGRGKGGFTLVVAATKGAVEAGFKAGEILKTVAAEVGGKGGGRPEMAQGRAPASADMEAALGQAKQRVVDALRSN
ncbi:MAG: alanine--tRNA ligase, partial [Planctomycetota bacterium]